ncbi:MAG: site-2 protease family protein [Zetaproteobacteria bacterium]|nr:MAG: site-2 protease family protein [Zetaproteobacteria bacterium]
MRGWGVSIEPWASVLGREVADVFAVEDWQVLNGAVRFRGTLLVDSEMAMDILSRRLESLGFVPMLHTPHEIALVRLPAAARRVPGGWRGWPLNLVLFLATLGTTLFVGAIMEGADPLAHPLALLYGIPFSASLLLILGCHELGHYLTARAYGVQVSLPYFVPLPLPPLGTMGAIIRMRSPIPSRKVLFDIGIAGPLAGLAVALPILALGLVFSPVKPLSGVVFQEGNSLAYLLLKWLTKGPIPDGSDVMLHPMALAGWLGLFVTALNLMPLSQLDGGHIAYAVLGRGFRKAVWPFLGVLVALFLVSRWEGWLVWVVLAVALGLRHPPPLDDLTPLDRPRRRLALVALGLLVALLTPLPFAIYEV